MRSDVEVSHVIPAPPANVRVNGLLLPGDCDDGPVQTVAASELLVVEWDPVETTHDEIGNPRGSTDMELDSYQVIVDQDAIGVIWELSPENLRVVIPSAVLDPGTTLVEIIARAGSLNQTTISSCFETAP